ncbi:MAG: phosphoglycerate mutase family protein [Cyclobacteriaceae bacterium]|nr:histidine phosphatase family protein [Cyclobacteriaceae bacterium]
MKKSIIIFVLALTSVSAWAQSQVTTLILVRHAERQEDGSKDPGISSAGEERAAALAQLLGAADIDAIYSTAFKRTRNTVQPLAAKKGLTLMDYNPMSGEDLDNILSKHKGKTVVVCGHSNTTPQVANYFLGEKKYPDFKDSDYDNLLILSVIEKGNATLTWLNYGAPTVAGMEK